jgi:hypothetical protein
MKIQENEERTPTHQGRRRESSYTDALDDPLRYLDQVKKYLGNMGEDEELIPTTTTKLAKRRSMRKSSGNM